MATSPEFERCFAIILRLEGVGVNSRNPTGYVNHPNDPGGETRFGISQRAYPGEDIKHLTRERALELYWRDYWLASGANALAWPMSCIHADAAVNQGVGRARRFLRQTHDPEQYLALRDAAYASSRGAPYWLPAWRRRLRELRRRIGM